MRGGVVRTGRQFHIIRAVIDGGLVVPDMIRRRVHAFENQVISGIDEEST